MDLDNPEEVELMLKNIKIDIDGDKFILNGIDVSDEIRTPRVTSIVSKTASIKAIREKTSRIAKRNRQWKKGYS